MFRSIFAFLRNFARFAALSTAAMWPVSAATPWFVAPPFAMPTPDAMKAELSSRREAAMRRAGAQGLIVLFSAEQNMYANDIEFPYREENDFYYLTGIEQTGAVLVLIPGATSGRELLFLPVVDRRRAIYSGGAIPIADAREKSGIADVLPIETFPSLFRTIHRYLRADLTFLGRPTEPDKDTAEKWKNNYAFLANNLSAAPIELYLTLPSQPEAFENRRGAELARSLTSVNTRFTIHSAAALFRDLREKKSAFEISLIRHAVDITAEAFQRVCAMIAAGRWEYELQAEFDYTFSRRHAHWGYPSIIGSGPNALTLHYDANSSKLDSGQLVVIDAGAEFAQYSADVTRTLPVDGKFTPAQAAIYELVYAAQHAAIEIARPGVTIGSLENVDPETFQGRAAQVAKEGLLKLGLITDLKGNEFQRWYLHGMTHQIGMNVHDPGRLEEKLIPGMTLTDEPGIYIRPDALDNLEKTPENEKWIAAVRPAWEKYKGIGVRIEDDLLITETGAEVLSAGIPSRLGDIEREIARLHTARARSPLP